MKDMQAQLEILHVQITECQRLRREAKSRIKRDIFARLVAHYTLLAGELERAIEEQSKEKNKE
ncbi:hypothetical protein [Bradyrhizobium sp. ARR65]|uniref:hypothetical protein n=1 Tax=Bradyrhizobium sp. ARR65 TaxID=1040989 RepID=UPI0004632E47|nr:hypothetical protein [Bradyrhizobium sp. ARR65]